MADQDRTKALQAAMAQIEKMHGKGSIMTMNSSAPTEKVQAISTGSITLDAATGVGGVPRGRVTEIYGPESSGKTTVCLHLVANVQKAGGIAAYIDAEHALDIDYAKKLGVDIDNLLLSQPDTGEQALDIVSQLVHSGAVDLVVIDSVAALVPKAEIEGDMGDSHMGLQARLMSQALRKLTGVISRTNTSVVFINQLRDKIGVMFGCMSYNTRVQLADGTNEKIGKIVNQRLPLQVLSFDEKSGQVVPRQIVDWHDNGQTEQFLDIRTGKPSGNGRSAFKCTPNHHIRTPDGWKAAEDLKVGDLVMQQDVARISPRQFEIIRGALMGDGALSWGGPGRSRLSARLRLGHGPKQNKYCEWKISQLANLGGGSYPHAKGGVGFDTSHLRELGSWKKAIYTPEGKSFSREYLEALTPLSLAIWYQDDAGLAIRSQGKQVRTKGGSGRASICVEAMTPETRNRVVDVLDAKFGIKAQLVYPGVGGKATLMFDRDNSDRLQEVVAPYIIESMQYKLTPRFQGLYREIKPELSAAVRQLFPVAISSITPVRTKVRMRNRFDISVEGTQNYFVDGIMVHNSPETTTGGKALKFYASMRLDIRRIAQLKDKETIVGNQTRVKVVKNKVAPPFKQAEFEILYAKGIDNTGTVLDKAVELDLIAKSGAFYSYGGERLAQGRENAKQALNERPEVLETLTGEVMRSLMGLPPGEPVDG